MAREPKQAGAQEVRDWARDNGYDVGERGRFSSEIVSAFNKAHRRNNTFYPGGSSESQASGNSTRTTAVATRTPSRSTATPTTRRAPSGPAQRETAPAAPRQRRTAGGGQVSSAVIAPSGTGLSDEQMRQYNAMLADANAVTGQPMELTIIRLAPAAVA